jgi:hypothetical protein
MRPRITCLTIVTIWMSLSCGFLTFREYLISASPSSEREIAVLDRCPTSDCAIRVNVLTASEAFTLYEASGAVIRFVEVSWSNDSNRVAIYIYSPYGGDIYLSYDFIQRRPIDLARTSLVIQKSVQARYQLETNYLAGYGGNLRSWVEEKGIERYSLASARKPPINMRVIIADW